ncbi:hypothetical protein [Leisingera sp.]|uniref:hypothetical protein n=1 Tax=Leisingera sp. TaxID=1879318 RepID=UPI003A905E02
MAENAEFTGKLGLESRDNATLGAAVSVIVDLLDDFGHPAETMEARAENTARLLCDSYHVTLRLRRVPLRRTSRLASHIMQPTALLDLSLTPVFPDHCDREISELLLAEMLRRLIENLEATSVEWQDAPVVLSCEEFLSAFTSSPAPRPASTVAPSAVVPAIAPLEVQAASPEGHETTTPRTQKTLQRKAQRPRGRACFAPIDQAAPALDAHCDRVCRAAGINRGDYSLHLAAQRKRAQKRSHDAVLAANFRARGEGQTQPSLRNRLTTGPSTLLNGSRILAVADGCANRLQPLKRATLRFGDIRRMQFVGHLLLVSALLLFLDSAGTVQAARPLLP